MIPKLLLALLLTLSLQASNLYECKSTFSEIVETGAIQKIDEKLLVIFNKDRLMFRIHDITHSLKFKKVEDNYLFYSNNNNSITMLITTVDGKNIILRVKGKTYTVAVGFNNCTIVKE
jgi:hypothetical protein